MPDDILHTLVSVHGNTIRVTTRQWAHITEAHDYMSGNLDKVLETLAEPDRVVAGEHGESLALRAMKKHPSHTKPLSSCTGISRMGL